jgi:hypothetical protein
LYDNAKFPFVYSSCEEAFMKATFPPNSSQLVDLMISDQLVQVKIMILQ